MEKEEKNSWKRREKGERKEKKVKEKKKRKKKKEDEEKEEEVRRWIQVEVRRTLPSALLEQTI